jgi:hypothetical protein
MKEFKLPRDSNNSSGFGASALFLVLLSVILFAMGAYMFISNPRGILTEQEMGILLAIMGIMGLLVFGALPAPRRSRAMRISKCVNCGARIAGGYLCVDCQEKLDRI